MTENVPQLMSDTKPPEISEKKRKEQRKQTSTLRHSEL